MEWVGFDVDPESGHLGLGYDAALGCPDLQAWGPDRVARLVGPATTAGVPRQRVLVPEADPFFRAELLGDGATVEPSFAVLVVTGGSGVLAATDAADLPLTRGTTAVVPYPAGSTTVRGDVTVLRCLPPDPAAGAPARPLV